MIVLLTMYIHVLTLTHISSTIIVQKGFSTNIVQYISNLQE